MPSGAHISYLDREGEDAVKVVEYSALTLERECNRVLREALNKVFLARRDDSKYMLLANEIQKIAISALAAEAKLRETK